MSTDSLIEYARNPRKNDAVVDKMVACIEEFGFRIPIVAKSDGSVVDGHLRLKVAKKLGLKEVPVVIADWAEWDEELLRLELEEDTNFDLNLTGFDLDEIDRLLHQDNTPATTLHLQTKPTNSRASCRGISKNIRNLQNYLLFFSPFTL